MRGPDERPASEGYEPLQELEDLRYDLPLRVESGVVGQMTVRWKACGDITVALGGAAVRLEDRIRERRKGRA